ncbi:MAG: hypothetical protein HPY75_15185 [Actinobacteria bacterium]|nr:hypothetical protein [Actinomycetota bacterium]
MSYALFLALQAFRYVYQYWVILKCKLRKRTGFLYGRRHKPLDYRLNSTNCVTIPYFLSENCQTQHLSLRLYGTDNEIQPETTYIQTGERIYGERDFLELPLLVYRKLSKIAKWMKWEAAIRYLGARESKSAFLRELLGKRLRLPPDYFFGRTYLSDDRQYMHLYTTKKPDEKKYDHTLLEKWDNARRIELPDGRNLTVGAESNIERTLYVGVCLRKHERTWLQFICFVLTALVVASGLSVFRTLKFPEMSNQNSLE